MSAASVGARLDALDALRGELGPDADSFMLGVLVAMVSDEDWEEALVCARSCLVEVAPRGAERTQAERNHVAHRAAVTR